jgi:hypothetical protein
MALYHYRKLKEQIKSVNDENSAKEVFERLFTIPNIVNETEKRKRYEEEVEKNKSIIEGGIKGGYRKTLNKIRSKLRKKDTLKYNRH